MSFAREDRARLTITAKMFFSIVVEWFSFLSWCLLGMGRRGCGGGEGLDGMIIISADTRFIHNITV